jgi:hypothetical protein
MEPVVLLGLMGIGYLMNKDDKNKAFNEFSPPIITGSGNSIYDQANYLDSKKYEIKLVDDSHRAAMKGDSKVVDSLNIDGRNTLRDTPSDSIESINGTTMDTADFLTNDQGVTIEPFFSGSGPTNVNLNDNQGLTNHQGGTHAFRQSRRERGQFFELEKDYGNVFGGQFEGARSDQSRYVGGMERRNELPFEQEQVVNIDIKSGINMDVGLTHAQRNNIDSLRTLNNQKESYAAKILSGKGVGENRGEIGEVFQHSPDSDYVNTADRWLVTTGAITAPTIQPTQIVKETNRAHFNEGKLGPATAVNFKPHEERPKFRQSTNQQFEIETNRNMNVETKAIDDDHNKDSYFAYPNERDVTTERTYEGNMKSMFNGETERIYDKVKPTIKETTNFEHTGNAGSYLSGTTANDKYYRADLNVSKEIISQGRYPVPENTKLMNGMDVMNVDIKKIESDYFNPRINNMDKIYSELPTDNTCKFTQEKDTLDNNKLSDRLDPVMLDPFKENPYTQSLASFAY